MRVESIMTGEASDKGPSLDKDTVIEDALQVLNQSGEKSARVMQNGEVIGSVTLEQMITAIARPEFGDGESKTYN